MHIIWRIEVFSDIYIYIYLCVYISLSVQSCRMAIVNRWNPDRYLSILWRRHYKEDFEHVRGALMNLRQRACHGRLC
jgi:hypothetical protein